MRAVLAWLALSGCLLLSGPASASSASCTPRWRVIHAARSEEISTIEASSPSDVWAAGFSRSRGRQHPLLEHWDGGSWSVVSLPSLGPGVSGRLADVAPLASDDVWAAGSMTDSNERASGLLLHWDGASWTVAPAVVPLPVKGHVSGWEFESMVGIASDDVWVVVGVAAGNRLPLLAEHWDGTSWRAFKLPVDGLVTDNEIADMAALAADDIWAVGDVYEGAGSGWEVALHWDGHRWRNVPTAIPGSGCVNETELTSVAAPRHADVWAAGFDQNCSFFVMRWNGHRLQFGSRHGLPPKSAILGVEAGLSGIWAFGMQYKGDMTPVRPLATRWTGTRWSVIPTPTRLGKTRVLDDGEVVAPDDIWAFGSGWGLEGTTVVHYACN